MWDEQSLAFGRAFGCSVKVRTLKTCNLLSRRLRAVLTSNLLLQPGFCSVDLKID